ncbi:hypothetical protein Tco_0843686 [Tanacetum coccineum]|uniref:Reverse transcriptase domain-containing protein n=1 Tax=Tanacetum coccineum TaxID=301880 RepID=A0ABQ5B727_9ASTR
MRITSSHRLFGLPEWIQVPRTKTYQAESDQKDKMRHAMDDNGIPSKEIHERHRERAITAEEDFLMEEIDAFLEHDDSIPPGVDGIYDSEGDIVYLEELLSVINSDPNLPSSQFVKLSACEKGLILCEDLSRLDSRLTIHLETPILVLKLGKCHFMVKKGIVLGHKISKFGIEVDKSKVDVIAKLPHPTTVKEAFDILKALPVDHPGDTKVPIYTAKKVLRFRFYWTTIYKDGMTLSPDVTFVNVRAKFRQRDEMTQYSIPVCKILTCGLKGVDFMGPFPSSRGNKIYTRGR